MNTYKSFMIKPYRYFFTTNYINAKERSNSIITNRQYRALLGHNNKVIKYIEDKNPYGLLSIQYYNNLIIYLLLENEYIKDKLILGN